MAVRDLFANIISTVALAQSAWAQVGADPLSSRFQGANTSGSSLVGVWRGPAAGPTLRLLANGAAVMNGEVCRYGINGDALVFVCQEGTMRIPFQLSGDALQLSLQGAPVAFHRVRESPPQVRRELVGAWTRYSTVGGYGTGTREGAYVLGGDGRFQYRGENLSRGPAGSAYGAQSETGEWAATETTLILRTNAGTQVLTLDKVNNPKNGDPMIVLDGVEYVTAHQRQPW